MIIELLPNHEEADIEYLESLKLRPISSVFAENEDPLDYLNSLFNDVQVLEEKKAFYHCDCSKERFMRNLLTLPEKDLEEIAQDPDIEIKCEFCDKVYHFDKNDIRTVLNYVSYKR